ncbi:histidine phosphatase family protein [Gammaproteobacteria bacterium AS21]
MQLIHKPFVFMRHGETPFNQAQLIGGITDSPLTQAGCEQAIAAGDVLKHPWSIIATSTLKRTIQTAQHALPNQAITQILELGERNWGDLEGQPIINPMVYEQTPANGESWLAFQNRVLLAINTLLEQHPTPLIVAHSGIYRVLCHIINGSPYGPRIDNATPYLFNPTADSAWQITQYKGQFNEI